MPRTRLAALLVAALVGGYVAGGRGAVSLALFTDQETGASTFVTAATFPDSTPPVVSGSVISKTTPYVPGFIRQGGTYHVYANVTDAGSGVATVTANVSTVTTGQTALALGCIVASALGQVQVGIPCVIGGAVSGAAIKYMTPQ